MAARSSKRPPRRRPLFALGAVLVLALAAIGVLTFKTRPTVVEIHLAASRVVCRLVPPAPAAQELAAASAATALVTFEPLAASLTTNALKIYEADRVEAAVSGVPLWLRPLVGGSIDLRTAGEPLHPSLALRGPARADVTASPRPDGGSRVVLELKPDGPAPAGGAAVPPAPALRLEVTHGELSLALVRTAVAAAGGRSARVEGKRYEVATGDPTLVAGSAAGRLCKLGLTVAPGPGPGTTMRVLDPGTGEVSAPQRVEMPLAEPRFVSWGERVVVLQPDPGAPATPLLRPDLPVRDLELWDLSKVEPESFVEGGSIRFPSGEKEKVDIEPGFFLTLAADRPLTLRALAVAGGKLDLVLWGRPQSVRLGPTPELQTEVLPNLFVWLYNHRLGGLVYSTLVAVTTAILGLFRLLGVFRD